MTHVVTYAIGDIHGEHDKLRRLHDLIFKTHERDYKGQNMQLVHLGDYVDRGPASYDVLEVLINLTQNAPFQIINLKGNHEQMMLEAYQGRSNKAHNFWLSNGGLETLSSYNVQGYKTPPDHHLHWIKHLKSYYWDKTTNRIFVHAGIDPAHFPHDGEDRHLWTRSNTFFNTENWGSQLPVDTCVIHGHTPTQFGLPDIHGDFKRINVDTGACYGHALTAVILHSDKNITPQFISVE